MDTEKKRDAQELNEQELAQVSGARSAKYPASKVCPHCTSDQYTATAESGVRE